MHAVIAWSGFLGAWLLVAGPLFQAAVELDEQGDQWQGLNRAALEVGPQPRLSPWWWLLPPVAYVKQARRQRAHRQQLFDSLSAREVEGFVGLTSLATGWAMVAAGAFFIAVKETYELVEHYEGPLWLFVALLIVMLAVCAGNTVVRIRLAHRMIGARQRDAPPVAP